MNKVIMCEGKTDAILLSYYLDKVSGWKYCKTPKEFKTLTSNLINENEEINCYQKNDDILLICSVGGKDNFSKFFEKHIYKPIHLSNMFHRVAIVTDRDNRSIGEIETEIDCAFSALNTNIDIKSGQWSAHDYLDRYGEHNSIELLLNVIPTEHQGALETVMLQAISENLYDRNIVEKCDEFTKMMQIEAGRYISTNRLRLKAHLGVTWAIQSPEKVFTRIDAQIKSVSWENYPVIQTCFGELAKI